MSYLVLARKYRPRNFTEMVGQQHVVQALTNALTQQRLHHAYLFTGTRGVGKTTVSRILAKSLNCQGLDGQGGITATPCGQCQACRDIDSGRFVDYTELDAASNRGVDEVQSLLEQAVYKPVQGRFKVFMIDEVHMLTNTAFNAMLKTLEEPPDYLKFVLATTDPQKVPVTVLSRCLQFTKSNLDKAHYEVSPLEDGSLAKWQVLAFDISALTVEAVKPFGLGNKDALRCKNMWTLGLALWMFDRDRAPLTDWLNNKFKKNPTLAEANIAALNAGHAYGETAELGGQLHKQHVGAVESAPGLYRTITGAEAVALGLVAGANKQATKQPTARAKPRRRNAGS